MTVIPPAAFCFDKQNRLTLLNCFMSLLLLAFCPAFDRSSRAEESGIPASESALHPLDWTKLDRRAHHLRVTTDQNGITLLTEGNDPYFQFELPRLSRSDQDWVLQWEYFCPQGVTTMQWRSGKRLHHPDPVELPPLARAEGWTTYAINLTEACGESIRDTSELPARIDLGQTAGVRLQLRNVLVRPISPRERIEQQNAAEQILNKTRLAEQIAAYHAADWHGKIESVLFDGSQIRVSGTLQSPAESDSFVVVARRPESIVAEPASELELSHTWPVEVDTDLQRFTVSIPSPVGSAWLDAGVRFQLYGDGDDQWRPVSAAVYSAPRSPTDITAPPRLEAAKGLTCITSRFSSEQLRQLGLQHASVNLVIAGIVSPSLRQDWKPVVINGRTWWVNEAMLGRQDRDIRTASDAGAVVAGILLLPLSRRDSSPLVHPESTEAGTYAMPNLNDHDASQLYAATLHVLAERYSGRHPDHGRIDHWIVHNEVDYGWQWTNMGMQPFEIFMDHYVRSMRLVDGMTRQFNPHARTFVSLTHRWNTIDNQHWKTYPPRAMVQWLIRDSQLAGDFPWGVAYHPYPQSLWKADVWNDTHVTDDFDTPLITIKNLQVLDRFMHQPPSLTFDGQVRPVICSEQGFHADAEDQEQLQIQSAALLYTWIKLRECPSIIAFDYHRPSDHPNEGGLRLGLRGLPSRDNPLGAAKPAWEVYQAIGTDREADLLHQHQHHWQSIRSPEQVD